jgi:PKD repeat protein
MRSIGLLAVVTGMAMFASGCSDGSGTPPSDNAAPVADFDLPACTVGADCQFVSKSSDDVQVTQFSWDLDGDGTADRNTATASFSYTEAKDYNVTLTVHDAEGLSGTKTSTITIAAPGNAAPLANFTAPACVATVACEFVSTSSDDVQVTEWSWDLNGDQAPDRDTETASFTYDAAGQYTVSLTVKDAEGLSNTKTENITVAAPPANTPPTAGFTHTCNAASCRFTSTSTDAAPGTIVTYAWNFGDLGTSDIANPVHNYAITLPGTFTVTLTVTDNEGGTDTETQTISVAPPVAGAEGCITTGRIVNCALNVTASSTMKVKLLGVACDRSLEGTKLVTPPPIADQVFLNICWRTVGEEIGIFGGPLDELIVYEAGSQVLLRFIQGEADPVHPPVGPPAGRIEGTFPDWTLFFDDGSNPTGAGEPDMDDAVVGVHATLK